ncbi:abscisic aldehyde oxidase 3, partial [Tanacetum coccineum]
MYDISRSNPEYIKCVQTFLAFAETNLASSGATYIWCPCKDCKNVCKFNNTSVIEGHLIRRGFMYKYTCWSQHGELLIDKSTFVPVSNDHQDISSYRNNSHEDLIEMFHNLDRSVGDDKQEKLPKLFQESEKIVSWLFFTRRRRVVNHKENLFHSQIPPSIAITPVLPTIEPEDSLIMGDENLRTIPEKESDEFIKSSVEDLVPILRESEDTSDSDKECDLPFCDNFVTFSNPFFDANDDFTSKVLEDIESKDSYVFNLDETALLVTLLSGANEDECLDPEGDIDEIDAFLDIDVSTDIKDRYHDSKGDI